MENRKKSLHKLICRKQLKIIKKNANTHMTFITNHVHSDFLHAVFKISKATYKTSQLVMPELDVLDHHQRTTNSSRKADFEYFNFWTSTPET